MISTIAFLAISQNTALPEFCMLSSTSLIEQSNQRVDLSDFQCSRGYIVPASLNFTNSNSRKLSSQDKLAISKQYLEQQLPMIEREASRMNRQIIYYVHATKASLIEQELFPVDEFEQSYLTAYKPTKLYGYLQFEAAKRLATLRRTKYAGASVHFLLDAEMPSMPFLAHSQHSRQNAVSEIELDPIDIQGLGEIENLNQMNSLGELRSLGFSKFIAYWNSYTTKNFNEIFQVYGTQHTYVLTNAQRLSTSIIERKGNCGTMGFNDGRAVANHYCVIVPENGSEEFLLQVSSRLLGQNVDSVLLLLSTKESAEIIKIRNLALKTMPDNIRIEICTR